MVQRFCRGRDAGTSDQEGRNRVSVAGSAGNPGRRGEFPQPRAVRKVLRHAIGDIDACRSGAGRELGKAMDGFLSERRRLPRDRGLARLFDARHPPVQRRNELAELAHELIARHLHEFAPARLEFRLETFQTSPQLPQRQ
jgi:hypothetical protein